MVGQWKRGYGGRYVVGHRDDAVVGNGDDGGIAVITDIDEYREFGSVAILPGDIQFQKYGGVGKLWGEFDRSEWGRDRDGPTGEVEQHTLCAGTYFD